MNDVSLTPYIQDSQPPTINQSGGGGVVPEVDIGPSFGPGNANDNGVSAIVRTTLTFPAAAATFNLGVRQVLTFPALAMVNNAQNIRQTLTMDAAVVLNAQNIRHTLTLDTVSPVFNAQNVRQALTFPALAMVNNAQNVRAKLTGTALGAPFWQSEAHTAFSGAASGITINKPTGTVDGDLLIAFIACGATATTPTVNTLSGWTLIRTDAVTVAGGATSNQHCRSFWKIASSEGTNYAWTFSASADEATGEIHRVNGTDPTTPINANAGATLLATALTTNPVAPTLTTGVVNCMVFSFLSHNHAALSNTHTEPAGFNEHTDFQSSTTVIYAGCSAEKVFSAAGSTGTMVYTCTETVATDALMQRIAVAPGTITLL